MKHLNWNTEKSILLKKSRGICFEDVVFQIQHGDVLDDYLHPNQDKYTGQRIMVVEFNNYAYIIPYVENDEELFMKTIIPSRKATEVYLGEKHENKTGERRKRNP